MKKTIIVGGLPNPIGGVTTFLRRYCQKNSDNIDLIVDCYPNDNKDIPLNLKDKFVSINSKFIIPIYFVFIFNLLKDKVVFFNFSSLHSVLLLGLVYKRRSSDWHLMLHHGKLHTHNKFFERLIRLFMNKFDVIYVMSKEQHEVLSKLVDSEKLKFSSSYVMATVDKQSKDYHEAEELVKGIRRLGYSKVFICSGYSTEIYNHNDVLGLLNSVLSNCYVMLFIYGPKDGREDLLKSASTYENVKIFQDKPESVFNNYLALSDCYIRPTQRDSFGIAVADAINFGTSVIASDVCPRYQGAYLYTHEDIKDLERVCEKYLRKEYIKTSMENVSEFFLRCKA
ncbi:TPA: glycosyltransferase [Vibrio parahaemolyticus]|uniref:glycosyltransferase n=1 Tax=Vibrio parahaemolyticus TaxID=670 RepID=UPI001123BC89|nr:glycosyltransferase [Vibrio parahaemolyticus]EGR9013198.1 glycosyltransferase [Vibrio parahaemolyticus]ELA9290300.1 glycosyltransferase [Vibrio parahaemolyticus]MCR9972010.1 glycosyltransferase [Vibrio parahaemolyticus]MCS0018954.1 glycosyltransferase [Vibrio parahaemolyticus]MCS0055801.1 glycosyltransferase [Vibrio parahaemolyticus]